MQMRSIVCGFFSIQDLWKGWICVPGQLEGMLNKYPYQPGVGGCTSNSLGCTDIWWQFIYLYSIWISFHSKVGQLISYLEYACFCVLDCSTLFCGLCVVAVLSPLSCFWFSEAKGLKSLKLNSFLPSLKMYSLFSGCFLCILQQLHGKGIFFPPFPSNSCKAHEENEWDSFLSLKLKGELKESPESTSIFRSSPSDRDSRVPFCIPIYINTRL